MQDEAADLFLNGSLDTDLDIQLWQIEEIKKAIIEANERRFASLDEVDAFFAQWRDQKTVKTVWSPFTDRTPR